MRKDSKALVRESKRVDNTLFKIRARVRTSLKDAEDKRKAYSVFRNVKQFAEDGRSRISNEFTNRTRREREALNYEASATGNNFRIAV